GRYFVADASTKQGREEGRNAAEKTKTEVKAERHRGAAPSPRRSPHQSSGQTPAIETHQRYKAELPKLGKQLGGMVQQPEQGQGTDKPAHACEEHERLASKPIT